LLNNPGWVGEFQRLVQRVLTLAQNLSLNYRLPGYPIWWEITDLGNAFARLKAHLNRIVQDAWDREEGGGFAPYGLREKIAKAYQWACLLVAESKLNSRPWLSLSKATDEDISMWLPTEAELQAYRGILGYLSHFDFEASLKTSQAKTTPLERKPDRQIIETLRAVGHRLTTTQLLEEMSKRELHPAESTIKKRLAVMTGDGRLNNDPKAKPRGYGLPEWNGSSGSRGS
jgi:hypothetical protein